jgi:hypothetical protein
LATDADWQNATRGKNFNTIKTKRKEHPMIGKEKEVQGVALYAEWDRPGALMQVIITPDGYAENDTIVPAAMTRRITTTENPRKQWRTSELGVKMYATPVWEEIVPEFVESRMSKAQPWFDKMLEGDWKIVKEPLLIEVSKKDLTDISLGRTPKKFLYRVELVRKSLEFPQALDKDGE